VKLHPRTLPVQRASADIRLTLIRLQGEHELTDIEMLRAVGEFQDTLLKTMLRAERHPDDPERKADET
jgi:hypothetical protein